MFHTLCPSRDDGSTEGILDVVSEQTKHTGIPFLFYEEIRSIYPGIRDARHPSFSAPTSHLKLDMLDRKERAKCEKQTHIRQCPLNPPDRATLSLQCLGRYAP